MMDVRLEKEFRHPAPFTWLIDFSKATNHFRISLKVGAVLACVMALAIGSSSGLAGALSTVLNAGWSSWLSSVLMRRTELPPSPRSGRSHCGVFPVDLGFSGEGFPQIHSDYYRYLSTGVTTATTGGSAILLTVWRLSRTRATRFTMKRH